MTFGEAIEAIKRGNKVARKGWNGKEQYIMLAKHISAYTCDGTVEVYHDDIGSECILFVGTRGAQMGWLASQADMLANDWMEV